MKTIMSLTVVTVGLIAGNAQAASDIHIDELAARLQRQTADLTYEIDHQFRSCGSYRHLRNDAIEMERLARHIHDVAHYTNYRRHIAADVQKLDRLFHHIEELVDRLEYQAVQSSRSCYSRRGCSSASISLAEIRVLQRMMGRISGTLHHLQDDLRPVAVPYKTRPYRTSRRVPAPRRPVFHIQF